MKRFIEGEDRAQATLFPDQLDDYIAQENAVRVIDVFVDEMDLSQLGFKTIPAKTGRPSYHPACMLKLYIYGYLNRIQSSRRLERESHRNIELMWLLARLTPDFKTIADFRRDNSKSIALVCRDFVLLCRKLDLFAEAFVAIDGSKFKAVNHRDRNFTRAKVKYRLKMIDESIAKYLGQIERADHRDGPHSKVKIEGLESKIVKMKAEIKRLGALEETLEATPDKQVSLSDPDCRSMKSGGSGVVGYNVQAAVDCRHHIIVTHEVTNAGNDRSQLSPMAKKTKAIIGGEELKVVADRGYYKGEEILACEQAGITTFLPKPQTSGNQAKGLFDKSDFRYITQDNEYLCPAGERLKWRTRTVEKGKELNKYWSSNCQSCALKPKCTTGKHRRVTRWQHEAALDALDKRMADNAEMMTIRKSTVEHPFGTIKSWMGATHFQMRTLGNVSAEMSLHVLAYNLKRVMKIIGIIPLMEAMKA